MPHSTEVLPRGTWHQGTISKGRVRPRPPPSPGQEGRDPDQEADGQQPQGGSVVPAEERCPPESCGRAAPSPLPPLPSAGRPRGMGDARGPAWQVGTAAGDLAKSAPPPGSPEPGPRAGCPGRPLSVRRARSPPRPARAPRPHASPAARDEGFGARPRAAAAGTTAPRSRGAGRRRGRRGSSRGRRGPCAPATRSRGGTASRPAAPARTPTAAGQARPSTRPASAPWLQRRGGRRRV